jgi:hypothetical protein
MVEYRIKKLARDAKQICMGITDSSHVDIEHQLEKKIESVLRQD